MLWWVLVFFAGVSGDPALFPEISHFDRVPGASECMRQPAQPEKRRRQFTYYRWPGVVPYEFGPGVSESLKTRFLDGAAQWSENTSLQFVPRQGHRHYLWVVIDPSIFAGGLVELGIGGGPMKLVFRHTNPDDYTIVHELGHALGFFHEHQRRDRDTYLEVLWENVAPGAEFAFFNDDYITQETDYDFLSVMHYKYNIFSANGGPVLMPKQPYTVRFQFTMGGNTISEIDRQDIADLYGFEEPVMIEIPDPILHEALVEGFDFDGDDQISDKEAATAYRIDLADEGIADFTGLEAFKNIWLLNIDGNRGGDLSALRGLEKIELLAMRNNRISDLAPLAGLDTLKIVWARQNMIVDTAPLEGLERLFSVDLLENRVNDLGPLIRNGNFGNAAPDPLLGLETYLNLQGNNLGEDNCVQLAALAARDFDILRYDTQNGGALECPHPTAVPQARWISHVTDLVGGFQTRITVSNMATQEGAVNLRAFDVSGNELTDKAVTVPANGQIHTAAAVLFDQLPVSHFSIEGCETCVVTAGYRVSGAGAGGTAHVAETGNIRKDFFLDPGEWDLIFDGMALVNLGPEPAAIEAAQLDSAGTVLYEARVRESLPPLAKQLLVFDGFFPQPGGRIEIHSSQPAVLLLLRGTEGNREPSYLFQTGEAVVLPALDSRARWLPHITDPDGGFATLITLTNRKDFEGSLSLKPYLKSGLALPEVALDLGPNQSLAAMPSELFGGESVSHVAVEGDYFISVSVGYRVAQGLGSTAHVRETDISAFGFSLFQGEWDTVWDGAAVVNLGDDPANISGVRYDDQGVETFRTAIVDGLAPQAKHLVVFSGLFSNSPADRISLESDQPISVVFLRGSLQGEPAFLYQTLPIPHPP